MSDYSFEVMREEDVPAISRILMHAFGGPRERLAEWITKAGISNMRVMRPRSGGDPAACVLRIPMGEYFGGKSIPLIGIAGVGVAPEARGHKLAGRMMAHIVQEMHAEGGTLSGLYPATQPLYRRVGYEQAGHRFEIRFPARAIDIRERGMKVVPIDDSNFEAVKECYAAFARTFDGPLDRGTYIWDRVKKGREISYEGFAALGEDGTIEGYLYLGHHRKATGKYDLELSDIAFRTPRAGRRLLSLLEDYSSMCDDIFFRGGPMHPALALISEQRAAITVHLNWMLRILDVKKAFEARGYPPGIRGELHLDVRDDLIAANQKRWIIRVEGGRASVEAGGRGDLRLDVRALAPLISGYMSAEQLVQCGWAEGAAANILPTSTPWLSDMY